MFDGSTSGSDRFDPAPYIGTALRLTMPDDTVHLFAVRGETPHEVDYYLGKMLMQENLRVGRECMYGIR